MDDSFKWYHVLAIAAGLAGIGLAVWLAVGVVHWVGSWFDERKQTYCTAWVKVVSIEPTFEDNGKHEDEQYIVKYEDGSVEGTDQGSIPYARCTNKVEEYPSKANPDWKEVSAWGYVDWQQ